MHTGNKLNLVLISIGLLLIMFSPIASGGFYPIFLSTGVALTGYAAVRLMWRRQKAKD